VKSQRQLAGELGVAQATVSLAIAPANNTNS
jgi:hypothetical protein